MGPDSEYDPDEFLADFDDELLAEEVEEEEDEEKTMELDFEKEQYMELDDVLTGEDEEVRG
jgi:hypothetical protein